MEFKGLKNTGRYASVDNKPFSDGSLLGVSVVS